MRLSPFRIRTMMIAVAVVAASLAVLIATRPKRPMAVVVGSMVHDLGTVSPCRSESFSWTIRNEGDASLALRVGRRPMCWAGLRMSVSFRAGDDTREVVIPPGGAASLEVTLSLEESFEDDGFPTAELITSDPDRPVLRFGLKWSRFLLKAADPGRM